MIFLSLQVVFDSSLLAYDHRRAVVKERGRPIIFYSAFINGYNVSETVHFICDRLRIVIQLLSLSDIMECGKAKFR